MTQTLTLAVTGMTCGGCENAVRRAIERLPGVAGVIPSYVDCQVNVNFDDALIQVWQIRQGITALGYAVGE
jgi:copper chaperone